jgi:hypothetical protein
MNAGRFAPFVLAGLFAVRIAACGGGRAGAGKTGTGGAGGAANPSAMCVDGNVSYDTGAGQLMTQLCPNRDCWIDAATGSGACMLPGAAGAAPFRTCRTAADCAGATYCGTWGASSQIVLGSPTCMDGVCDWATQANQPCAGGQYCYPFTCATFQPTTSGGFPWNPGGVCVGNTPQPGCLGGGGVGGGDGGAGGSTGSANPAATCVNGDIAYADSNGQPQMHACPNHDCWIDAATGSAACMKPSAAGVKPFRTCRAAADCSGATYCATWGDSFTMLLGSATCADNVCDWSTEAQQSCSGGQLCWPAACATVFTGTTSGGFPWDPCPPGAAGACGTTSARGGTGGGASGGSGGAAAN